MGILRKDYILDRWVYFATSRKKRPHEFKLTPVKVDSKNCRFCPKAEKLTPPEIGRVEYKGAWRIRWFLNLFPAVDKKGSPKIKEGKFFSQGSSYGTHEIIVETSHHKSMLADLPVEHIRELLEVCKFRVNYLGRQKGINYVQVFKNHGKDAGTSLVHSHTQVVALAKIPQLLNDEISASKKFSKCPYCDVIKKEAKSKRKIFETKNAVAFAPFASRFSYEAWIFPKKHRKSFEDIEEEEYNDIAAALKKILVRLKNIDASYNMFFHYSPKGEDLHFHIEITPRIGTWAGFELSTNEIINSVLPEDAAKFYRK